MTVDVVLRTGRTKQVVKLSRVTSSLVVMHLGKRMVYDLASVDDQLRFVYTLREDKPEAKEK